MRVLDAGRAQATTREAQLRRSVEQALRQMGMGNSLVSATRRRSFPGSTSYAVEIVTADLATGQAIDIFVKDYGRTRLPKDAAADRRERERRVYGDLLQGEELGTARLYGELWDDAAAHFWLMLEFVDGELLRDCEYEDWIPAVAWLGRLHRRFAYQRSKLRTSGFLVQHDASFFVGGAERALRAVSGLSEALAQRFEAILDRYDPIVTVLAREPETLVHGSYRPQNVLVVRSSQPPRICPTDWELAAFGRSSFDLAFICDGFRPPRLDELLDAYERGAESPDFQPRDRDELRHEIDCFRLHKRLNSLGHLHQWPRPAETAAKVVASAEQIADALA